MVERVEKTKKGDAIDMPNESVLMEETSVDWRGRPCKPNKHGGMTAAVFVLGLLLDLLSFFFCVVLILFFHVHHAYFLSLSLIYVAWPCSCMPTKSNLYACSKLEVPF